MCNFAKKYILHPTITDNAMRTSYRTIFVAAAVCLLQGIGILQVQADNSAWMAGIPDNTFVSQLSIPGTHDAGTGHGVNNYMGFISGSTYAVTQEKTLTEQWNSGIRAFDLRPAVDGSRLRIYHGVISTNLYMDDALSTLCGLLDSHPTETCIVIIRHEDDSESDDNKAKWPSMMKSLLTSAPTSTHAVNYTPEAKLGDVRGKILILSRNNYDTNPIGGYISGWGFSADFNNQKNGKISGVGTQGSVYIQDFYDVSASGAPATKTASVERMLQFSTSENTNPGLWIINQTSGYSKTGSMFGYTFATSNGYRDNAATQNAAAAAYINSHPGPTGIILMDFAAEDASSGYNVKGQTLTNAIINSNTKTSPNAEYFRALSTIIAGNKYVVSTKVNGVKYYLTTRGQLTNEVSSAGIFTFSRVEGAAYTYGYNLQNAYFTSPTTSGGTVNYNSGRIRTNTTNKRKDWEAQVFFKNNAGKYAVRATNAQGTGNQEAASNAFWTVNNSEDGPVAEYSSSMNYIWDIESTIDVTYNINFGGTKYAEVVIPNELGSTAALPEEYIHDFCSYSYSPRNITKATVNVTVSWLSSAPFKITTESAEYWYNLKAGRLQRFVGWEAREPYRPHAYDEASVENYPENELYATDLVRASDAYQWAFVGNPIEGFKIVNRLLGEDYSLTVDGTSTSVQGAQNVKNTVLREGDFRWTVHANNDGFSLSLNGQENCYINTHGGPHGYLQIWETANAKTDLGSRIIAEAVPGASVPMTQIGTGYYTTLCMPYDVIVSEAKVYVLDKVEEGFALLTLVDETVPAGTPIVLRGENATASLEYGAGFTLQPSTDTELRGLFVPANPVNVLTLQDLESIPAFCAFADNVIEPYQAYLNLNDNTQAITLKFSDIEDGIHAIDNELKMNDDVYNLSGQRISRMQKGINIFDSKKIIKK